MTLFSKVNCATLIGTCFFGMASVAEAEYYEVFPADQNESDCCCCQSTRNATQLYHGSWRSKVSDKRNSYRVEYLSGSFNTCIETFCPQKKQCGKEIVSFRFNSHPRGRFVNPANLKYDPDTTTGDDEIMRDSNTNNQY